MVQAAAVPPMITPAMNITMTPAALPAPAAPAANNTATAQMNPLDDQLVQKADGFFVEMLKSFDDFLERNGMMIVDAKRSRLPAPAISRDDLRERSSMSLDHGDDD